jgi:anti-sigma regulatory factor (Ser/Thr protein kinase)
MEEYSFTLKNNAAEIEPVQKELEAVLKASGVRLHFVYALNIALGEWLENVIQYAYSDHEAHQIQVQCLVSNSDLRLRITDDGREFDPGFNRAASSTPPESSAFASRGLHVIRSLMDEGIHERRNGQNVLLLTKRMSS